MGLRLASVDRQTRNVTGNVRGLRGSKDLLRQLPGIQSWVTLKASVSQVWGKSFSTVQIGMVLCEQSLVALGVRF